MTRRDLLRKAAGVAIASMVPAAAAASVKTPLHWEKIHGADFVDFNEFMAFMLRELAAANGFPYEMLHLEVDTPPSL